VSSAGAAGNADLGGSSKYSGKHPGDARLDKGSMSTAFEHG